MGGLLEKLGCGCATTLFSLIALTGAVLLSQYPINQSKKVIQEINIENKKFYLIEITNNLGGISYRIEDDSGKIKIYNGEIKTSGKTYKVNQTSYEIK